MLPASLGAAAAFLLLVAPGIVYELTRQRRRPTRQDSGFIEASRILLAGSFIAITTLVLLVLAGTAGNGFFVSPHDVLLHPTSYAAVHPARVLGTIAAYLAVAATSAVFAADCRTYGGSRSLIVPDSAWFLMLERLAPTEAEVHLAATLTDGSAYMGRKVSFTSDPAIQDRELVLGSPLFARAAGATKTVSMGEAWERLVLPGSQVATLAVSYVRKPASDEAVTVRTTSPVRWLHDARRNLSAWWRRLAWWPVALLAVVVEVGLLAILASSLAIEVNHPKSCGHESAINVHAHRCAARR